MNIFIFLRSIFMTLFFLVHIIFFRSIGFVLNFLLNKKKMDDQIIAIWAKLTCLSFGVKINVHNIEKIPSEGCLFLFNHSSFFDIFALAARFSYLRFGAKIELFKIPFFGPAMKRAGTLPIARNNRENVFKIYEQAKSRFMAGEKFALSPEGGRFYGNSLAPFKAGPFVFAMSAGVPVLPVVIKGAYQVLPMKSFLPNRNHWRYQIDIYVLDPISTKNYNPDQRHELQKIVYDQMNSVWKTKSLILNEV